MYYSARNTKWLISAFSVPTEAIPIMAGQVNARAYLVPLWVSLSQLRNSLSWGSSICPLFPGPASNHQVLPSTCWQQASPDRWEITWPLLGLPELYNHGKCLTKVSPSTQRWAGLLCLSLTHWPGLRRQILTFHTFFLLGLSWCPFCSYTGSSYFQAKKTVPLKCL